MPRLRFLPLILAILTACPALAADSMCKFLSDTNAKVYAIPTHLYSTVTAVYAGGKTRSSELIYLNNTTYVEVDGKWTISKATPKTMAEMHKNGENDHPNATCRAVRSEPVNGEAAMLYSLHEQTPDTTTDSQIWISKSRGLPLKAEMDVDLGGKDGKSHRTIRYEYAHVQAPAGVH